MFGQFFGHYLFQNNIITQKQFSACIDYLNTNTAKLSLIAESEGLLTINQVNELHRMQMQTNRDFNDLAMETGYLSAGDIDNLLCIQGNSYLVFVQALQEIAFLSNDEVGQYLLAFQHDCQFSDALMKALKANNLDELLSLFIPEKDKRIRPLITLALRNIIRFISPQIRFEEIQRIKELNMKYIALQCITGDYSGFLGFACDDDAMLFIAENYLYELFEQVDGDVLDCICEFANNINGLYATELSYCDVEIDMLPPECPDGTFNSEEEFFIFPVYILNKKINIIASIYCKS